MTEFKGIVLDIDNTAYTNPEYFADGNRRELEAVAKILGHAPETMQKMMETYRKERGKIGNTPTVTETVYHFGITPEQWSIVRQDVWRPESFLKPNPPFVKAVDQVARLYKVVFATNAPCNIGVRVLRCVGLNGQLDSGLIRVLGPESIGVSKHDPVFFRKVAELLGVEPALCVSIGDREKTDATIAMAAGYGGAVIVSHVEETVSMLEQLIRGFESREKLW